MMPATKHLDPIIGVDIHLIITPPGPVVPIPHPHIGMVFDPFDYLPIIGSTVNVNYLPRAQAGTGGVELPPHFPIGGVFAKPPANENETFMGSATVAVDGDAFTSMTLPVLSCQDIGMPSPPRKRGPAAKTLLLPTSVVLSIPVGPPVRVGGPPIISLTGILQRMALGMLLKMLKKLLKLGKVFRKLKNKIKEKVNFKRGRNATPKNRCTKTGDPVDVVTGRAMLEEVDWELPGPIPLRFERNYSSSLGARHSVVGFGWSHSLDLAVWETQGQVTYRGEEGREIDFDATGLPNQRVPVGAEIYAPIDRLTLRRIGNLRWEVESDEGLTHELRQVTALGPCRVVRTRNRSGHSIVYEYDERGLLDWVVDSAGRRVRFEHGREGYLARVWLPHNTQPGLLPYYQFTYSESGDLIQATDALGHQARYAYSNHLLVKKTDRTGLSFHFEYDGQGPEALCVHTWGDNGIYNHHLAYDKEGNVTEVSNSLGHTTTYHSDGRGVVVKEVDPAGSEWLYEYDFALRKTAETNPLGHTASYEYDARGNCIKMNLREGALLEAEYDEHNCPTLIKDVCGGIWRTAYNAFGLPSERIDPLGARTRYSYHGGLLRSVELPNGARVKFEHDTQHNVTQARVHGRTLLRNQHDRLGRIVSSTDANGIRWSLKRDALGRVLKLGNNGAREMAFSYDGEGNLLEQQEGDQRIRFSYSGYHKLAAQVEAGSQTHFGYDTEGLLAWVRSPTGQSYELIRDACGRIVEERGFDGRSRRFAYDGAGRMSLIHEPSGVTRELKRDSAGRVVEVRCSDGSVEKFVYREDGGLLEASNATSVVRRQLDALGRLVKEWQGDEWIESGYDSSGNRVMVSSSLRSQQLLTRNEVGHVQSLEVDIPQATWRTDFERDPFGRELARRMPGELVTEWRRSPDGLPLEQRTLSKNGTAASTSYQWKGIRLSSLITALEGSTAFQHDSQGRLAAARYPDGSIKHRILDDFGNIYRRADRMDRLYDEDGVLQEANGVQFRHDESGNLIEKVMPDGLRWHYTYDSLGRLIKVTRPDQQEVRFAYDALGRRVSKSGPSGETKWVWDGDHPLHELSHEKPLTTWVFTPETFAPLAKIQGDTCFSFVTDHLGTPTSLYDANGSLAWRATIDIYGVAETDVALTKCPWRWPGQYEDEETGLYYNRHRYYDPETGQYISQDPMGLLGGINPYAYTSDPTTQIDPLGLNPDGHHTIPRRLMEAMSSSSYNNILDNSVASTLGRPNSVRGNLPMLDHAKHSSVHGELSRFLEQRYPNLPTMTKGFQKGPDWESYLDTLQDDGKLSRKTILDDLDDFYNKHLPKTNLVNANELSELQKSFSSDKEQIKKFHGCG